MNCTGGTVIVFQSKHFIYLSHFLPEPYSEEHITRYNRWHSMGSTMITLLVNKVVWDGQSNKSGGHCRKMRKKRSLTTCQFHLLIYLACGFTTKLGWDFLVCWETYAYTHRHTHAHTPIDKVDDHPQLDWCRHMDMCIQMGDHRLCDWPKFGGHHNMFYITLMKIFIGSQRFRPFEFWQSWNVFQMHHSMWSI